MGLRPRISAYVPVAVRARVSGARVAALRVRNDLRHGQLFPGQMEGGPVQNAEAHQKSSRLSAFRAGGGVRSCQLSLLLFAVLQDAQSEPQKTEGVGVACGKKLE